MSKSLIIGIVAGIIAVGGGLTYFVLNKSNPTTQQSSDVQATQPQAEPQTQENLKTNGNLSTLTNSGKPQKCSFTYSSENGSGSGTMYSDGKGRGLMQMSVQANSGQPVNSNILMLSDRVYSWSTTDGKTFGIVFDRASLESHTDNMNSTQHQVGEELSKSYDIDCTSWSVDETLLVVPTNITFTALPASTN